MAKDHTPKLTSTIPQSPAGITTAVLAISAAAAIILGTLPLLITSGS